MAGSKARKRPMHPTTKPAPRAEKSMRDQPDLLRHSKPPRLKFWAVTALCVAGAIAAAGIFLRFYDYRRTAAWSDDQDTRTVQLVKLSGAKEGALILPGDVQPWIN